MTNKKNGPDNSQQDNVKKYRDILQKLPDTVAVNIKNLLTRNNINQRQLAEKARIATSVMSEYCNGKRVPSVDFLLFLKVNFGISIDDFLTKTIPSSAALLPSNEAETERDMTGIYEKFSGIYFVYYFDTSKYKGSDTQPPRDSVMYGILYIYKDPSSTVDDKYRSAAILGINERDDATYIRKTLKRLKDPAKILEYINANCSNTAYFGDFELSQEHAFFYMRHTNTDRVLFILRYVPTNKEKYIGGIGTVNSVSKGRERTPVIQFMGISRSPLSLSEEEIHRCLLLNYSNFNAESETEEVIRNFKALYVDPDAPEHGFPDHHESIMVTSILERLIRDNVERNMFRYQKITDHDDDDWYHAIKDAAIDESI